MDRDFFISSDGYVLTASHVVGDARHVKVKLATDKELPGEVIVSDPGRDVALIKVSGRGLPTLPLRKSQLPIGSEVYAIGSPFALTSTMTRGIVSNYRELEGCRYIQSDVNIEPGNSGGPLVDGSGNVVGIADLGLRSLDGSTGINFFIPIDDALTTLKLPR